jgi:hypothetical protein
MIRFICDRCGRPILEGQPRYIARIQVYAAPDPIQITIDDLLTDHRAELEELLRQCEQMTEDELMRDVYVELQFDLCRACQRAYLADPMPLALDGL